MKYWRKKSQNKTTKKKKKKKKNTSCRFKIRPSLSTLRSSDYFYLQNLLTCMHKHYSQKHNSLQFNRVSNANKLPLPGLKAVDTLMVFFS